MIRHRDKSNTLCGLPFHLRIQMAEQNSFGLIMVKDPSAAIAGKCNKVTIQGVIHETAIIGHGLALGRRDEVSWLSQKCGRDFTATRGERQSPLVAARPRLQATWATPRTATFHKLLATLCQCHKLQSVRFPGSILDLEKWAT